jgi:type II secretory pathway component GspD/PulD (secretin)
MAEAVAVLSLLSNILQVIGFGTNFASTAWKIYQGARHGRQDIDEVAYLRNINASLRDALRDLHAQAARVTPESESSRGIVDLSEQCTALIEELLRSLDSLGLGDVKRKRDALRATFKLAWKREKLDDLQSRLDGFRAQLHLSLLVSMRFVFSYIYQSPFLLIAD